MRTLQIPFLVSRMRTNPHLVNGEFYQKRVEVAKKLLTKCEDFLERVKDLEEE